MKPILVTSGEPAGVGPDICLALAGHAFPIVVVADKKVIKDRAKMLGIELKIIDYKHGELVKGEPNHLTILSTTCADEVVPGKLNVNNSKYVLHMLDLACKQCLLGNFSALVTAPVHKGVINQAGIPFSGHTEYFSEICNCDDVVMLLASKLLKVALVTTHIPIKEVSFFITKDKLRAIITNLHKALQRDFSVPNPKIMVAGLNPHAGENGFIGREEIEIINPVLSEFREIGLDIIGPLSADTMFIEKNIRAADAFLVMYHDQGLPVLKYSGFSDSVNITLGLPIVRTSVDHGTALELAGTGLADASSLLSAVTFAVNIVRNRAA